jgi:Flp pilus assembly protein TadD
LVGVWHWDQQACEAADAAFGKALAFDIGDVWLLTDRGRAQLDCGNTTQGEANLRLAGQSGFGSAWGYLAESSAAAGRTEDAHDAVVAWSQLDIPSDELAWRGRWRVLTGDAEGGLQDLVPGLVARPEDIAGMAALLQAATQLRRLQTAFAALSHAQSLRPTDRQLLGWLGDLAAEIGDEATALRCYQALDRLTGGIQDAVWRDLARVALRTQDPTLAHSLLARPASDVSLRAGLLGLTGSIAQAEQVLGAALQAAPLDRTLALRLAQLRFAANDLDGALAAVAAIGGLTPSDQARLQAQYLARAGDRPGALQKLEPFGETLAVVRLQVRLLLEEDQALQALGLADAGLVAWPGDLVLRERRVLALQDLDRGEEALAEALALLQEHPGSVAAVRVFAEHSEPSSSLERVLWTSIEANPGEPELWLELALSRWVTGPPEPAQAAALRGGQLLGRDTEPGERYSQMCASLSCRGGDLEEGQ